MAWRNSAAWLTGGMALSAGLVWLGRAYRQREFLTRSGHFEPVGRDDERGERLNRRARLEEALDRIVREETTRSDDVPGQWAKREEEARTDALHDIFAAGEGEPDPEVDLDTKEGPQDVTWPESAETARPGEHFGQQDEPYDAVDTEDVGAEWLLRATQGSHGEGRDPVDVMEGTRAVDSTPIDPSELSERDYGIDRSFEPMAPYAPTEPELLRRAAAVPPGKRR